MSASMHYNENGIPLISGNDVVSLNDVRLHQADIQTERQGHIDPHLG